MLLNITVCLVTCIVTNNLYLSQSHFVKTIYKTGFDTETRHIMFAKYVTSCLKQYIVISDGAFTICWRHITTYKESLQGNKTRICTFISSCNHRSVQSFFLQQQITKKVVFFGKHIIRPKFSNVVIHVSQIFSKGFQNNCTFTKYCVFVFNWAKNWVNYVFCLLVCFQMQAERSMKCLQNLLMFYGKSQNKNIEYIRHKVSQMLCY